MRLMFLLSLAMLSGCKTLELAVTHPTTGIHITARMEGQSPVRADSAPVMKRLPSLEHVCIAP